jgi:signal transduction histidine kinase/DNA-binding response OmpR family regulator
MNIRNTILLFSFYFICINEAPAQNTSDSAYVIDVKSHIHSLVPYSEIFIDSSASIDVKEMASGKYDDQFIPLSGAKTKMNAAFSYWIKFSASSAAAISNWWLVLHDTSYGYYTGNCYVDVYMISPDHSINNHLQTGSLVSRSSKSIPSPAGLNAVLFSLPSSQSQTFLIRIRNLYDQSQGYLLPLPEIRNPEAALPANESSEGLHILSGVMLILVLYALFFFVLVKERAYLWYACFSAILCLHYLILDPKILFIDLFIPDYPGLMPYAWTLLTRGLSLVYFLFGKSFISLSSISKKLDRWLKWLIFLLIIFIVVDLATMAVFKRYVLPSDIIVAIFMLGGITIFVRAAFYKNVLAKIFLAGAVWLILFTILGLLYNAGVVRVPFNPWPVGQVGQLLIFGIGLAYKIRLNEKARAEAMRIKEMDNIKSKFFANISHEFRTPLTLIQGPLQQIEEQMNETGKNGVATVPLRQIKTMRRNTDRLLELVNQLLDLSRLDSGKMELQIIKGDVLQLLKSLAASFDSMGERKQIHYHIHFPEQTPIAFFDKDKLEKIFTNLLSNAFKYTPEKGTVSVIVEMDDNRLRLSVEDNGPGIAKKELDKIFDRFYQVEGTEDKGTGIGLALVKELVDLYRGQISVSSEPGKGSRFRVSLPIDKNAFKENELVYGEWKSEENFISRNVDEKEEMISNQSTSGLLPLLLVVEDNNDLRRFICETVQQNYQVTEAKNGQEGFEKAMAEIPDVIISDVMMPVMDGFAMTGRIKKDERTSHIPVILLTAKAGQQHKIEGLETGADDYLTKPFDAKELLVRIQNLIDQRKLLRKKFAGNIQLKPSEISVKSIDEIFLTNVMQAIEKNMEEEEFGVEELAKKVTMSRSQLHRKLIALIDKPPSDLIRQTRLLRAKELLQKKASTPSEVAFKVGFSSHTYFSKCFKEEFGISPGEVK